jgi:hypothetical protein
MIGKAGKGVKLSLLPEGLLKKLIACPGVVSLQGNSNFFGFE